MTDRELVLVLAWIVAAVSLVMRPDEAAMRLALPPGTRAVIEDVRLAGPLTWDQPSGWHVVEVAHD